MYCKSKCERSKCKWKDFIPATEIGWFVYFLKDSESIIALSSSLEVIPTDKHVQVKHCKQIERLSGNTGFSVWGCGSSGDHFVN